MIEKQHLAQLPDNPLVIVLFYSPSAFWVLSASNSTLGIIRWHCSGLRLIEYGQYGGSRIVAEEFYVVN